MNRSIEQQDPPQRVERERTSNSADTERGTARPTPKQLGELRARRQAGKITAADEEASQTKPECTLFAPKPTSPRTPKQLGEQRIRQQSKHQQSKQIEETRHKSTIDTANSRNDQEVDNTDEKTLQQSARQGGQTKDEGSRRLTPENDGSRSVLKEPGATRGGDTPQTKPPHEAHKASRAGNDSREDSYHYRLHSGHTDPKSRRTEDNTTHRTTVSSNNRGVQDTRSEHGGDSEEASKTRASERKTTNSANDAPDVQETELDAPSTRDRQDKGVENRNEDLQEPAFNSDQAIRTTVSTTSGETDLALENADELSTNDQAANGAIDDQSHPDDSFDHKAPCTDAKYQTPEIQSKKPGTQAEPVDSSASPNGDQTDTSTNTANQEDTNATPATDFSPEEVEQFLGRRRLEGHGPQRHLDVTDDQLKARLGTPQIDAQGKPVITLSGNVKASDHIDPMTGTTVDGVDSTTKHRCGSVASAFRYAADYVKAETYLRTRAEETNSLDVSVPIEEVLGKDGAARLRGFRHSKHEAGRYEEVDFMGGVIFGRYKRNKLGNLEHLTMFAKPINS